MHLQASKPTHRHRRRERQHHHPPRHCCSSKTPRPADRQTPARCDLLQTRAPTLLSPLLNSAPAWLESNATFQCTMAFLLLLLLILRPLLLLLLLLLPRATNALGRIGDCEDERSSAIQKHDFVVVVEQKLGDSSRTPPSLTFRSINGFSLVNSEFEVLSSSIQKHDLVVFILMAVVVVLAAAATRRLEEGRSSLRFRSISGFSWSIIMHKL
jgi:hypothetical protein